MSPQKSVQLPYKALFMSHFNFLFKHPLLLEVTNSLGDPKGEVAALCHRGGDPCRTPSRNPQPAQPAVPRCSLL